MKFDSILRVGTKIFLPFILVFALYVQFHGDFGPGGGFQAGVIAAAMLIFYAVTFGLPAAQRAMPSIVVETCVALGVLLYTGVGIVSMLNGGEFLNYSVLDHHDPAHGQHLGILLVELGVLITVFGTMTAIFYNFAGRGR